MSTLVPWNKLKQDAQYIDFEHKIDKDSFGPLVFASARFDGVAKGH